MSDLLNYVFGHQVRGSEFRPLFKHPTKQLLALPVNEGHLREVNGHGLLGWRPEHAPPGLLELVNPCACKLPCQIEPDRLRLVLVCDSQQGLNSLTTVFGSDTRTNAFTGPKVVSSAFRKLSY